MVINVGGIASWGKSHPLLPLTDKTTGDKVMSMRICKIKDCENKHDAKGYCNKHYKKLREYGDSLYTKRHGMYGTPEYETWVNMKARCYNKKNKAYFRYGERGIIVCGRWKNSFIAFYKDMGSKPFAKAQIDRKNNDLGYFPENCHWVTSAQNSRHQSTTKLTMEKARAIRKAYKAGGVLQRELALLYGVVGTVISDIIIQKRWVE